jgi:hypothetical protein
MKILGIDPHKRSIAWASFWCGELRDAGHVKAPQGPFEQGIRPMLSQVGEQIGVLHDIVVVEFPRIYAKDRGKRPNDLLDVAGVAAACFILGEKLVFVYPRTWKGQVPKDITKHRSKEKLDHQERQILTPWEKNDHVWDAVGIGQWYLETTGF